MNDEPRFCAYCERKIGPFTAYQVNKPSPPRLSDLLKPICGDLGPIETYKITTCRECFEDVTGIKT